MTALFLLIMKMMTFISISYLERGMMRLWIMTKTLSFSEVIRDWALTNPRVPHSSINDLLRRLRGHDLSVPIDVRTLLKTSKRIEILSMGSDEFWYNGIRNALLDITEGLPDGTTLSRVFNIDGTVGFNSAHGCIKCSTVGEYDRCGRHMSFPRIDKIDEDPHKEDSPLLDLPINMVKQFIVADSLHILDLDEKKFGKI